MLLYTTRLVTPPNAVTIAASIKRPKTVPMPTPVNAAVEPLAEYAFPAAPIPRPRILVTIPPKIAAISPIARVGTKEVNKMPPISRFAISKLPLKSKNGDIFLNLALRIEAIYS